MLGDLKLEAMNATLGRKLEGQIFEREQHQQTVRQLQDNLHTMERKVRWTYGTQRMKEINDISRLERVIGRMILERFGMRVWHRARMAMRRRWHQWLEVMLLRKYRLQSMQDLLLRHWRTVLAPDACCMAVVGTGASYDTRLGIPGVGGESCKKNVPSHMGE